MIKNKIFSIFKKITNKEIRNLKFIFLSFIFFLVDLVFPKKKNLIVFAQKNRLYSDNSRAFFEYLINNQKNFTPVWLADDLISKNKIKKINHNANVKITNSIDGLLCLLNAKTVVTSNSLHDFFPYFHPSFRKESIQLWHGIKWSKHFEYPNNNFTKELTIICSSSEDHKKLIYQQNLLDEKKVYITGLPRNDQFFIKDKKKKSELSDLIDLTKKIILYAPTHKEDVNANFFPFKDLNLNNLNEFLKKNKMIIYLRPHINDTNKNQELWESFLSTVKSNYILPLTFKELEDINSLLPFVKTLITDYSTIYTDALLLNIPTLFVPYDLDNYKKKRGLVYKFDEVAVGPKIYNQYQLISELENINKKPEHYVDLQSSVKRRFHKYNDGDSSNRILKILKERINS